MMADFHFLRPWWLAALIPVALLTWAIWKRQDIAQTWNGIVAPHLLPFLLQGRNRRARFAPLYLIALGWVIAVLAIAGPTWKRESSPFAEDTAALAIVIKVSPSMKTEDVQPSRLARATEKIHDLLKQRAGAKTSLIAYGGSAHVVMPATSDGGIIDAFAQALDPKIMPKEGDAAAEALRLADQTLTEQGTGSILWITDSIAPEQASSLASWRKSSRTPVRLFPPLLPGPELDAVSTGARPASAILVNLTPDDADVITLARAAKFATAATGEKSDRWEESGYWLTPLLAIILLPFFRRGWMAQTASRA
jgi:Ca-activated chloride channel family protein